jgi:hypothetical protein
MLGLHCSLVAPLRAHEARLYTGGCLLPVAVACTCHSSGEGTRGEGLRRRVGMRVRTQPTGGAWEVDQVGG